MRTRVETEAEHKRVMAVECPQCAMPPGRWCRMFTGHIASKLHVKRMRAAGVDVPKSRTR